MQLFCHPGGTAGGPAARIRLCVAAGAAAASASVVVCFLPVSETGIAQIRRDVALTAGRFDVEAAALANVTDPVPVGPSATGADAFTIGGFTFDPVNGDEEGFGLIHPLTSAPPLLTLGGGFALGGPMAGQEFEVFDPADGADLGSINTSVVVANLAGFTNTQFTVVGAPPATDVPLPTVGSVYDVFNLGGGFANVYTAIVGADGGPDTVTDTFLTPFGNIDLTPLFGGIDAAALLQPGDAFAALEAGAAGGGEDAFAIGGFTLDPFSKTGDSITEGFTPVAALTGAAPFLNIGGGSIEDVTNGGIILAPQSFDVYSGSGDAVTQIGTIDTAVHVTNLLGLTNTQLMVTGGEGDGLPAVGTVYDAVNFGGGFTNIYTATPGADGVVTDTLITPMGSMDLSSLFGGIDVAEPLNPGNAFTELAETAVGKDAFSIGDTTFDPFTGAGSNATEGFAPVFQTIGAPPLLNIGGGTATFPGTSILLGLAEQDFHVYDGTGADAEQLGSVHTQQTVTQLLGLTNSEFTVDGVTAATGVDTADLPAIGSVYDVLNFGGGFANVYTAIPGLDDAGGTVTDILVTPLGNVDLSALFGGFDASSLLDPGDAFLGLDI
ncbi:hypothetical protein [Mycolicibacter sinensis]|uniref:Uncharacterized protein n=1 Tax=Mycolicibacter sinensis (strain JDM601) TaxID=875328 RepID=A0A1A2EI09_MYCSD|nr:hypothetical protein [Mycolicibacter sinensis]OBG04488.1 hypothetical protein A5772_04820 [Mycolicibacter sinensis]OBG05208.1 hypothetical protein A5771_10620 [Mycolicibacter sinensis]